MPSNQPHAPSLVESGNSASLHNSITQGEYVREEKEWHGGMVDGWSQALPKLSARVWACHLTLAFNASECRLV